MIIGMEERDGGREGKKERGVGGQGVIWREGERERERELAATRP